MTSEMDTECANAKDIETVESIGSEFTMKYFDALVYKPNSSPLRKFYNENSIHVFAQHGHPDYEMHGLYLIGCFMKRMAYSKCTVTVRSVSTATRPQPSEFAVTSTCQLWRPGNNVPSNFVQTFVIKRVPWTKTDFQIVETLSRFEDEIEYDFLPNAVAMPITACPVTMSKQVEHCRPSIWLSGNPFGKATAVDGKLEESSPRRTDISNKVVNSEASRNSEIERRTRGTIVSTNCGGKLKNSDGKTAARSNHSVLQAAQKSASKKPITVDNKSSKTLDRDIAIVSKKPVAECTVAALKATGKNASKVDQKSDDKRTTTVKQKHNNVESTKTKTTAQVEKKNYTPTNRYEFLAVDDESDSNSIISDVKNNSTNSSKNESVGVDNQSKPCTMTPKRKKLRRRRVAIQRPAAKQLITVTNPTTEEKSKKCRQNSAAVHSSVETLAKRNESIGRKSVRKTLVTTDEDSTKNIDTPGACVCTKMMHNNNLSNEVTVQSDRKESPTDGAVQTPAVDHNFFVRGDFLTETFTGRPKITGKNSNSGTLKRSTESTVAVKSEIDGSGIESKDSNGDVAVEPIESKNDSRNIAITAPHIQRRIGRIYRQAFIREIVYPLCFTLNPLSW